MRLLLPTSMAFMVTVLAACAANRAPEVAVIDRTRAPVNYEQTIRSYLALTTKGAQKNRPVSVGTPEPGGCAVGGYRTSDRGWVVPVTSASRSGELTGREPINITANTRYFWFREDTIYGVTPRIEECP